METSHFKKALSLFLAVIMLFSVMPAAVFATQEGLPVMKVFNVSSVDDFHATAYCGKVYSVTFLDRIDTDSISASDTVASWDISHAGDGSVMAWAKINDIETTAAGADRYDIYIGGEGGVQAHEDTTYMFYAFQKLEVVNGLENLHTGKVKSFKDWFSLCSSLESIDLSALDTSSATSFKNLFFNCRKLQYANLHGWNTENVTDMSYMFYNCVALKEVDLRSFDTSKVTTMYFMFYRAGELTNIYIGSGWTNESIANLNESVFNCCYAIRGGKEEYDKNPQESAHFAVAKPEGNLEIRFKVEYRFSGDVPEGIEPPETEYYEKYASADVENTPTAPEGYIFTGWETQDVTPENGSFTVTDDVLFVGEWSRVYKVNYIYTGDVPAGAPAVPLTKTYKAGDSVAVEAVPAEPEDYVFVGWSCDDVVTTGGDFTMPAHDVTLYGYFKKPVSGVVINTGNIVLNENDETKIEITVNPEDATIKDVIYESGDSTVVTVDENGNITAVGEGTTTVTVSSKDDPTKKDTIIVKVKIPVEDIVIENEDTEIAIGEELQLTVTVNPDTASVKDLEYTSSNESVAKVDNFGKIIPVGEGTTVITVTSKDNPEITETITITVVMYKVTYEFIGEIIPEGMKAPQGNKYASGAEVVVEEDSYADGYIFSGWSTKDTADIKDGKFNIYNDVHFVGSWEKINYYDVTYKYEGEVPAGAPAVPGKETYEEGSTVTTKNNPSLDGYIFSGWETKDVTVTDGKFDIYNDVEFVGKWEKIINYYDVTYKYEGEVPAAAPTVPGKETFEEGSTVTTKNNPALDGYIFSGWETKDVTVTDGKFDIYSDVEFIGKWEKIINYYDVTYKYEGEIPAGAPAVPGKETYEEGSAVTTKNNPSLDGYVFSGWETKDVTVTDGKFDIYNDVEFIGKWEKIINYYDVTYKYEGEVPAGAPAVPGKETYKEGSTVTTKNNPSLDGYIFSGWVTKDVTVTDGKFDIYNDVEFVGKWEKIINYYDVTYKYEGEVPAGAPAVPGKETFEEGSTVTTKNNPTLDGYVFSGWETKDVTVTDGKFDIYSDVEFVGKWEKKINYYKVTYRYKGDVPVNAPALPAEKSYEEGSEVTVAPAPSFIGYEFSGWSTQDADITNGKFGIYKDVVIVGRWTMKPGAVTSIVVPDDFTIVLGEEAKLEAYVNGSAYNQKLIYSSDNESVIKVDADGNITTVGAGTAKVKISSAANPDIYGIVTITVTADPAFNTKHYIVFGRTEHIGWYNVSLNGGETFFPVYGNSHLEVEHGTEIIIKARDMVGDPFTFYVNGTAVKPDENGYIRILVDRYLLIGALGIPVEAPDVEESMSLIERFIKAIKDFFNMIASWFKR